MDLHDCPCFGKTLARLVQPAVLATLAAEPLHGYVIVRRLAGMQIFGGQRPDPTGVYRVLKAMEQDGLVSAAWELADRGPAKRRFALTRNGQSCLAQWGRTLAGYQDSIGELQAVIRKGTRRRAGSNGKSAGGRIRGRIQGRVRGAG